MIVSGGENVFPSEVEELLHQHPSVADVAVVGVPDDEFGQVLSAFVVRAPGKKLTKPQVRDHVRQNLARHKVPREVTFVKELPRNTTGKLLRRTLADQT
jgi:fatty-acyl-CoA synthase